MRVCGDVALSEFADFWITVRVKGVVEAMPSTASERPLGKDANVRSTVFGCRLTLVVVEMFALSVAVSCSSRYEG